MSELLRQLERDCGSRSRVVLQRLADARVIAEVSPAFGGESNYTVELMPVLETAVDKMPRLSGRPFLPRVTVQYLEYLLRSVDENESLRSMEIVSMLYAVGLGVPFNKKLADIWLDYSNMKAAYPDFDKCVRKLKRDVKDARRASPDGTYAYLGTTYRMKRVLGAAFASKEVKSIEEAKRVFSAACKEGHLTEYTSLQSTIAVAGAKVVLVYKMGSDRSCNLIDGAFYGGEEAEHLDKIIGLPFLRRIKSVPNMLCEKGNMEHLLKLRKTVGTDSKTFVVSGVLTVPKSKMERLRTYLPDVKSTLSLISKWNDEETPMRPAYSDKYVARKAELDSLSGGVDHSGIPVPGLIEQSQVTLTALTAKLKDWRKQLKAIQKKKTPKSGTIRKYKALIKEVDELAASIVKMESRERKLRKSVSKLRAAHTGAVHTQIRSQPSHYLEFIASDIHTFDEAGDVESLVLGYHKRTFLQTLGFNALNHAQVLMRSVTLSDNLGDSIVRKLIAKADAMYGREYSVTGICLYPDKTVKISKHVPKVLYVRN